MSKPDIRAMFDRLNDEHFNGEIPDIPVVWNNRLRTTAGRCHYKRVGLGIEPKKIEMANRLFEANDWDMEKVERTLIHEMVHAYLAHKYNVRGHNWQFQQMMTDITGERKNHRCHNYDTSSLRESRDVEAYCPKCDRVVGHRARMPRTTMYTHRGCGNILVFRRNEQKSVKKMGKAVGFSLGGD